MLSPQTLSRLPDPLVDLVNELQTDIIRSIAQKLTKADYLTPSAEWQLYKAQQLRLSTADVNKLLRKYTKLSRIEIKALYTDACKEAISNDSVIYRQFGKDASSFFRSVAFSDALKAGIKNANGMFENFTKSTVLSSRKTVTHLMDKAYLQVLSGAFSPQEAIYSAVRELADKGIQSVTYPSGKTDWADVAVRRAVITGIGQTTGQMQLDLAAEMGTDLVEVTSHMGARPSHAEWQGKVYSISGKSRKYPSLRAATGYGRGDGLKGWNCRHDFFPFFEGLSERANLPVDLKENEKQYKAEQKQRAIERSIRKSKRGLAALDSSIQSTDDEQLKAKLQSDFDRKAATLKKQEQRLAEHCRANDLLPRNDRTRVVGFGRSVSQKAVHGSKRYTAKKSGSQSGGSGKTAQPKPQDSKQLRDELFENDGKPNKPLANMSIDKSGESGIIKSKGLGAKIPQTKYIPEHEEPRLIDTISYNDKEAVNYYIDLFEKNMIGLEIEHALVITRDGQVFLCNGVSDGVFPNIDLGDIIKGSTITHNHPMSEEAFSFSPYDIELFEEYGLDILRGCDDKYIYELNRNPSDIDDLLEYPANIEELQHSIVIQKALDSGYGYRRWRRND